MRDRHDKNSVLSKDEQHVQQALNSHLNAEVDGLDFNVTSKLAAARHRALSQQPHKRPRFQAFGWQSVAGGALVMAVAYIIGSQMLLTPQVPAVAQTAENTTGELMEDLPILAEGDDFEFYQNIEFLEWLESST